MRQPQLERMYPITRRLPRSPRNTIEERTDGLEPATQPLKPGMHRKKTNTAYIALVLLSFGLDIWENIVGHLSIEDCVAFAATCR